MMSEILSFAQLMEKVDLIDPIAYAQTRNFTNGSVTKLSPYISRGILSTNQVATRLFQKGYSMKVLEPLLKELLWRDYFQRLGQVYSQEWDTPMESEVPAFLLDASSEVQAVDHSIKELEQSGYMHNHVRMYLASITLNVAKHHYNGPAKWLFYHLLDGDFASNTASWLWVNGDRGKKKYWANQENINYYTNSFQVDSFLNLSYEELPEIPSPKHLERMIAWQPIVNLPKSDDLLLDENLDCVFYTPYNLDPNWHKDEVFNRILWLQPSYFKRWPCSDNVIRFLLANARLIVGLQVFVGELEDLQQVMKTKRKWLMKEHPLFKFDAFEYEERDWIVPALQGEFPSFFNYWNKASKHLAQYEK